MASKPSTTRSVRDQGVPDGLFRSCMDVIRTSHTKGQMLRTLFIMSGVFSDKLLYAELLTQFYVTTEALGALIDEASEFDLETLEKYKGFHLDYLSDLSSLLGPSHLAQIDSFKTPSSLKYIQALKENASHESLLAGIIILWGPMVIGGGAMLYPKVKKAYGGECVKTFEKFIGAGREQRRKEFIDYVDTVGSRLTPSQFSKVVDLCDTYMKMNNEMMIQVKRRPWWFKWGVGVVVSVAVGAVIHAYTKNPKK
ncbi:hypothetical protein TrST_g9686 [Triparma strigata]|uniref:Heme oxygenase n=1 Tax=Triparma strigata TaxID=1606541 RepID=A0A9W7DWP6_9STRA|nr:hypothetical protein TrST_g9686 [Triparma strigata]